MLQKPGVAGYFGAKDVPGGNDMGAVVHDEECFASEVVTCIGQPIGVVVADTEQHARMAARLVSVEYEDLPALISIEDAIEASSYYEVTSVVLFSQQQEALQDRPHMLFCSPNDKKHYRIASGSRVLLLVLLLRGRNVLLSSFFSFGGVAALHKQEKQAPVSLAGHNISCRQLLTTKP